MSRCQLEMREEKEPFGSSVVGSAFVGGCGTVIPPLPVVPPPPVVLEVGGVEAGRGVPVEGETRGDVPRCQCCYISLQSILLTVLRGASLSEPHN